MNQSSRIFWQNIDDDGRILSGGEYCTVEQVPDGLCVSSTALFRLGDGGYCEGRFDLWTGKDGFFQEGVCSIRDDTLRTCRLTRDGTGDWEVGGDIEAQDDLSGCDDIDIGFTPFTNSLPIRRLGLEQGEKAEVRVAHVVPWDGLVKTARQVYARRTDTGGLGGTYEYINLDSGFSAQIEVDADGFVLRYPGLFKRVWRT